MSPSLRIAGIRGIPATHGGFETFCERLAPALARRGWKVTVYCQRTGEGDVEVDEWEGVTRVHISVPMEGPISTVIFDWKCIRHASSSSDPVLILGYNTGIFALALRLKSIPILFNMDGVEWARAKWSWYHKLWLFSNDLAATYIGNHLIADHPEIARMLARRRPEKNITTIPYGAPAVIEADSDCLRDYGLQPHGYALVIARPEPENSILEIVCAYSASRRAMPLVVLGNFHDENQYHQTVLRAAGDQVKFVGGIFDQRIVSALRYYAQLYIHGHQVGGTNPSLVEAFAAGNAVLAHGNKFNRWCAGEGASYFDDQQSCAQQLDNILESEDRLQTMRQASLDRHRESFLPEAELDAYENCLAQWVVDDQERRDGSH